MRIIVFAAALAALFTAALLLPVKGELILGANARVFSLEVGPKLLFGLIRPRIKRKTVLLDDGKLVLLPSGRALKLSLIHIWQRLIPVTRYCLSAADCGG